MRMNREMMNPRQSLIKIVSVRGIAQALEMIGRTWARLDRKADAEGAYAEAMRYYGSIQMEQGERDVRRCRFLIRQAEDPLLVPTDEEREALAAALLVFYNGF
ncbi:hypothetical protein GALMADRAFT_227112 [Galerina marginata CBS 339.88]|uniref:Uncharacterized protein n=1 Tax=Galerina marginata (strain CBS 339.88) TaxID=685588 RepID=A0A067T3Y0_GALM3|nr:hypothetical protein GALMADRAFT_227112 [Galerina marginata CBS 339.88]